MKSNEKRKYINLYDEYINEAAILLNRNKNFTKRELILDEYTIEFIKLITSYFSQDANFAKNNLILNSDGGDLDKGLYIYGDVGLGKSFAFRVITSIANNFQFYRAPLWFRSFSSYHVVGKYNRIGDEALEELYSGNIYIDDIGFEPVGNHYGRNDVFTQVLNRRHYLFIEKGLKTFLTTNLDLDDFMGRYGIRIYDRACEMFNVVKIYNHRSFRS